MNRIQSNQLPVKSPYASYAKETVEKIESTKKWKTHISEIDFQIIKIINSLIFSNTMLVHLQLKNLGYEIEKSDVGKCVHRLWLSEYIDKYHFLSNDGYSSSKTLVLGWRGKGLLHSNNIHAYKITYAQCLLQENNIIQIKNILAANQYAVCTKNTAFETAVPVSIDSSRTHALFRAHCLIQDTNTLFVQSIRRYTDNNELIDKLSRINNAIKHKEKSDVIISGTPIVVLVCEDAEHMSEIAEFSTQIKNNKYSFKIVNDIDVYSGNDNSMNIGIKKNWFHNLIAS